MGVTRRTSPLFFALSLLFIPPAHASVLVTEVMYDPPAVWDRGYEWIEIFNAGDETLFIRDLRLFVDGASHILQSTGTGFLSPNRTGVVAQNADVFFSEYPRYAGPLFLAPFSLGQEGRIRVDNLREKMPGRTVLYTASELADGTGGSLHVTRDGIIPAPATPGIVAVNPITVAVSRPFPGRVARGAVAPSLPNQPVAPVRASPPTEDLPPVPINTLQIQAPAVASDSRAAAPRPESTDPDYTTILMWIAVALTVTAVELFCILLVLCFRRR